MDLIKRDFDDIENQFLKGARRIHQKRAEQLVKRIERKLGAMRKAYEKGETENLEGLIESIGIPSQKEWRKLMRNLIFSSIETGILRAHDELSRYMKLYNFAEGEFVDPKYKTFVVFPKEAREFLNEYALNLSTITDETTKERIKGILREGLEEGISNKELFERIERVSVGSVADWQARTIARTENSKMYNMGRLTRYQDPQLEGFVEALQYSAIVDTRTTEICRHLDFRVIPIQNQAEILEYTPPNHFQCRSVWLPVNRYEEWENTWSNAIRPEGSFRTSSPLPKMLKGATEPLVKTLPTVDPSKLSKDDIDAIRALEEDEDFVEALKNIDDIELKERLVSERGRFMFTRDYAQVWEEVEFKQTGIGTDMRLGSKYPYTKDGKFYLDFRLNQQRLLIPTTKANYEEEKQFLFRLIDSYNEVGIPPKKGWERFIKEDLDDLKKFYTEQLKDIEEALKGVKKGEELYGIIKGEQKTNLKKVHLIDEFIMKIKEAHRPRARQIKLPSLYQKGAHVKAQNSAKVKKDTKEIRQIEVAGGPFKKAFEADPLASDSVNDAIDFMQRFYSPRVIPSKNVKYYHHGVDDFRAYAYPQLREIHFGNLTKNVSHTVVHEVGHVLHNESEDIMQMVTQFFKRRTKLGTDEFNRKDLQVMYEYKGRKEYALPDDFQVSYMGRVYIGEWDEEAFRKHGVYDSRFTKGEEIISMGFEQMYRNPGNFYSADPDYFGFIYAIMKGVY